jgi:hypothetical protein
VLIGREYIAGTAGRRMARAAAALFANPE